MTTAKEPTYEDAKDIVDKHDEALNPHGLAERTDTSSGVVMKANDVDKSILTYDPADPDYDEKVRKAK